MVTLQDLKYISDYEWEIPQSFRADMRVPVRLFATRRMLEEVMKDKSLEQAVNAATLPGLVGRVIVMPDMHQGYGFPIGAIAATRIPHGVISPGGIGYDINCGVRLLGSHITLDVAEPWLDDLATALNQHCPSGVGEAGAVRVNDNELIAVCKQGSRWALAHGFASEADLRRTEESGCVEGADPDKVSLRARQRGRPQLGSLGAGNHFIEIDLVEQVFEPVAASVMGLEEGMLSVQIHCGSRGFGHQICTDYVEEFQEAVHRFGRGVDWNRQSFPHERGNPFAGDGIRKGLPDPDIVKWGLGHIEVEHLGFTGAKRLDGDIGKRSHLF